MRGEANQFRPDYAVAPGSVLDEHLEVHALSHAEFARRCGRSPKLISEIISGKATIEPETALQFETVLGVDARIWLGLETNYQLHKAREHEAASARAWLKTFPLQELRCRGAICRQSAGADVLFEVLSFFGVGSMGAWKQKYGSANVAYRHSPSFKSDEVALATWLRLGELAAEQQECPEYNEARFKQALKDIRPLTRISIEEALPCAQQLCNRSGVALAWVQPLPKTALSGAAWWLSPRKAMIQLSARHKSDDHLWFSFFHEAAHILLHSKRNIFVDKGNGKKDETETEANDWAANALVPKTAWERFISTSPRSKEIVQAFAEEQGICPGIVVGMLQHQGIIPWNYLNDLKVRLTWPEGSNHAA